MYEYKVLSQRDKRFAGNFDSVELEAVLNDHAADGWRLAEALLSTNIMKTAKTEFMMILERRRPDEVPPA